MSHVPPDLLSLRHARARDTFAALGTDGLVVTSLPNISYLTGFAGSAAIVLIDADRLVLITDGRYRSAIEAYQSGPHACPGLDSTIVEGTYEQALGAVLRGSRGQRIGFEAAHVSVARHAAIAELLDTSGGGPALVPTEGIIESLRIRKDPYEQGVLAEGARRLSSVALGVLADIREGLAEIEIAQAIEAGLRRMGFSRPAFDTIVASGSGSALPHARAGHRRLAPGDLVVIDFGGVFKGYCLDLTRTVSVGEPQAETRKLFEAVNAAHSAALSAVRPGVATRAIDHAARDVLDSLGYGVHFVHGTGHGLGLEVHEAPRVGPPRTEGSRKLVGRIDEPELVEPGWVFTVEPGAYVPGLGGVRIEDDVLVKAEGCDVLTTVDRELRVC
jgi:Xaa-Pro aminopeptidase